ncbi:MAG: class I SAM-dependent methyltransferase, partial [Geminicoccaceae bacterium]
SVRARLEVRDLACGLPSDLAPAAGITASALLDLTSAAWLERLALACRGRPALFALSFDGRLAFEPEAGDDQEILRRFVRHQRTDKGFGPALGRDAAKHLADRLRMQGSDVALAPSDWCLGPADRPLLQAMLEGLLLAVREVEDDALLAGWAETRRAQAQKCALGMTVGHLDLLALPR